MQTQSLKWMFLRLSGAVLAAAALGQALPSGSLSAVGAAMAQSDVEASGHVEGGGEEGHAGGSGSGSGGHQDGGDDGHGGGPGGEAGKHGEEASVLALGGGGGDNDPATRPDRQAGGAGRADYFRIELGIGAPDARDAFWQPPNYPSDPQVFFAPVLDRAGLVSIAVGRHFPNDMRGEIALVGFGASDFTGAWTYTEPPTTGPHASVAGSTNSIALMLNGFYDLSFEGMGSVRPYVSAGLGVAGNNMHDWTLIKPDGGTRLFEGSTVFAPAWSLGAGISVPLGLIGGKPSRLDIGYRYFDLGMVKGSAVPLEGEGSGQPVAPLSFEKTDQTVTVSLRVYF